MSKFINLPYAGSYNGDYFTGYDEVEHKRIDFAIPIDKIREIKDRSKSGSLINCDDGLKERTYKDGCLTEITMIDGTRYIVTVRTTEIVKKINELEGSNEKENDKKII